MFPLLNKIFPHQKNKEYEKIKIIIEEIGTHLTATIFKEQICVVAELNCIF
jgi:hypothetical protein